MITREEKNKDIQQEIVKEESKKRRRKIGILFFKIILIIIIIFSIFYAYTKYISTTGLIVKEKRLVSDKLPDSFHGSKIVQFSDLHYGSTIFIEDMKSLVKKINKRNPDIIFFTGDLIDKNYQMKKTEQEELIKELKKITSPSIGKYAVLGDEDSEEEKTILKQSGFTILDNSYELIYHNDYSPILLVGLSSLKNNQDIKKAFSYYQKENSNKDIYTILLMHEADVLDEVLDKYKVDIALAGGSLNGQICLTKKICLLQKEGSKKYFEEYYHVNDTDLFVSSGLGTSDIQFRFMARPSINFLRLAKK